MPSSLLTTRCSISVKDGRNDIVVVVLVLHVAQMFIADRTRPTIRLRPHVCLLRALGVFHLRQDLTGQIAKIAEAGFLREMKALKRSEKWAHLSPDHQGTPSVSRTSNKVQVLMYCTGRDV